MKLPPIAMGAGGGLLLALVLAPFAGSSLGALAAARAERSALTRVPPEATTPLVASGLTTDAAPLAARIRAAASQGGVLVEEIAERKGGGGLVRLRLRVSGPEKAVVALADRLERDAPLVRLRAWRLLPLPDGGVRLVAEAVAVRR